MSKRANTLANTPKFGSFTQALRAGRAAGMAARGSVVSKNQVAGGSKVRVNPDPPQFTNAPWWQVTLVGSVTLGIGNSAGTITVSDLNTTFNNQLNTSGDHLFRVRKVRAFHMSSISARTALGVEPFDFTNNNIRAQVVDVSARDSYARVAYVWPLTDQSIAKWSGTNGSDKVVQWEISSDTPPDSRLIFYWDVLWKFNTYTVLPRMFATGDFRITLANESSEPGDEVGSSDCGINSDIKDEGKRDSTVSVCCLQ